MLTRWAMSRLGCVGPGHEAIRRRLLDTMPLDQGDPSLEAAERQSASMLNELGLDTALHLPGWEHQGRLREVARWGAELGALGAPRDGPYTPQVLREAAAFNAAVALFDTVVDEAPHYLPVLSVALNPRRLADRLSHPNGPALVPGAPPVDCIIRLFDYTLRSLGQRVGNDKRALQELSELLREMYDSECGYSSDPFSAKTLPVTFIGTLANLQRDPYIGRMFHALSLFIQRWDDSQDLFIDWMGSQTNSYLWVPVLSGVLPALGCFVCGCLRVTFSARSRVAIEEELVGTLRQVLAAARAANKPEVLAFMHRLVEGRPERTSHHVRWHEPDRDSA